jgi:hypothetical protein
MGRKKIADKNISDINEKTQGETVEIAAENQNLNDQT